MDLFTPTIPSRARFGESITACPVARLPPGSYTAAITSAKQHGGTSDISKVLPCPAERAGRRQAQLLPQLFVTDTWQLHLEGGGKGRKHAMGSH